MNKEVKETIKILQNNSLVKSGSYEFIGDSDITYAEIYILLKFIEDLQQENQQLKILISSREEVYRKLEDNWNKLKEYIENMYIPQDVISQKQELLDILKGCGINE